MGHRHRSALKQQNKAFKGSSGKPKSLKEKRRTAAANASALALNRPIAKADRLRQSKQRRLQQRREQQHKASSVGPPPKVVLVLPFSDAVCIDRVFDALTAELLQDERDIVAEGLTGADMDEDGTSAKDSGIVFPSPQSLALHHRYLFTLPAYARNPAIPKKHQQQLLLLPAPRISAAGDPPGGGMQQEGEQPMRQSELLRYMDLCSSCDVVVCVFGGTCTYDRSAFSSRGYKVLQALKMHGLPPSVVGVGCIDSALLEAGHSLQGKAAAAESLKFMRRFFESELGAERKFFGIGSSADWRPVFRALGAAATLTQTPLEAKSLAKGAEAAACRRRGHLLGLSWRVVWRPLTKDSQEQPEPCLEVAGLVRGAGLTCKLPVHITGVGDFVASRIEVIRAVDATKRREPSLSSSHFAEEEENSGVELQGVVEASQPLQPLDMAALEQTWPTREELEGDVGLSGARNRRVRVPKDVGDYERAWLESDTDGSRTDSADEHDVNSDAEMQAEEEATAGDNDFSHLGARDGADDDWKPLNDTEQQQMKADK